MIKRVKDMISIIMEHFRDSESFLENFKSSRWSNSGESGKKINDMCSIPTG